jgi:hypothetical protein
MVLFNNFLALNLSMCLVVNYFHESHYLLGDLLGNAIGDIQKNRLETIMNENIDEASTWPDHIKYKLGWSKTLHYLDIPYNQCGHDFEVKTFCQGSPNICERSVYTGILNMTNNIIQDHNTSESWKFLIHFLQDLHQPLHLIGDFRGGNDKSVNIVVNNKTVRSNFHTLWDKYIPETYLKDWRDDIPMSQVTLHGENEIKDYLEQHISNLFRLYCHLVNLNIELIDLDKFIYENSDYLNNMYHMYIEFSKNIVESLL